MVKGEAEHMNVGTCPIDSLETVCDSRDGCILP